MGIGEIIIKTLSRKPAQSDYVFSNVQNTDGALNRLKSAWPQFPTVAPGKKIVDFGCGAGHQSIALVKEYRCTVVGIENNPAILQKAINNSIPDNHLSFVERASQEMQGCFDMVISQNSFEHFSNPSEVLSEMTGLLTNTGILLVTFGPPWFAPYGSHMMHFCKIPWINILFSEKTVMNVRSLFRSDGARRYEDVESGLNKMTIKKFERIIAASGLKVRYRRYDCVKGLRVMAWIPLIRELFINQITIVLAKS
jgi:cyclopropane fatty-acyl-phospholipid synthase-like methyltransferase